MELDRSRQDLPKVRIPLLFLYGVLLRFYAIIICGLVDRFSGLAVADLGSR